jgi:uncharacterized protein YkwD
MTNSDTTIYRRFLAALPTAGAIALGGAILAAAAAAAPTHRGAADHARHRCQRQHRWTHRSRCARQARRKRHAPHRLRAPSSGTPAALPSGPCPDGELIPTASNLPQVRAITLCLINKIRVRHGKLPLLNSGTLDRAAQGHSEDMVAKNYFEHTSPSGEKLDDRIVSAGYVPSGSSYELGENIECGTLSLATPVAAVRGWMSSRKHRANILNEEFRDSGIGVAPAVPAKYSYGKPGATYTQDFGVVASS